MGSVGRMTAHNANCFNELHMILSGLERKKSNCFHELCNVLSDIVGLDILVWGIANVCSDAIVPNKYINRVSDIKMRLARFGGKFRSRTKRTNNLKELCDLWRRVGQQILNSNPQNQTTIHMKVKRKTVGWRTNNKRLQKNVYTYYTKNEDTQYTVSV